ncbi:MULTISPECIES: permease [Methanothermobacter]|uniref:Predicted permease n=1 Tax=Methanothermobacter marburgensis (strain ATCC BAA-927 / DSM 2133 / JCM 14651 / NBRC 100331 / OCM 82 / Marburg) TaxID=79929 RepID=D9PXC9_METTM|nr:MULTISPECIES: permease [Methanothermobacter]ADL58877.1 predicted permease [Methanothermobacter marburgensis str. Marburg]QHN07335.1 permease [Methanothermobacter sp. THM-2]WBF09422.1 permease [Methanothermobacter marburgensis]
MLQEFADYVTYNLIGLEPASHLGSAVNFFIYDTIKIFILLATLIFVISFIRTYIPPNRVREILEKRHKYTGNFIAALVGIITPFCSCSAVPLFIGFVEAGVPLGATFSFLISSPMINEIAIVLLLGLFGWQITAFYIISGYIIAVIGGVLIGKLKMESQLEDYVYETLEKMKALGTADVELPKPTLRERYIIAKNEMKDILRRVSPYIIVAIAIGGWIHGYLPSDFLLQYAGSDNILAVPMAVLIGVPLYSNAAGTIPLISALIEKGMAAGTALALMMSITALSLPEMIILRKVMKPRLLGTFIAILAVSITLTGYLFNLII